MRMVSSEYYAETSVPILQIGLLDLPVYTELSLRTRGVHASIFDASMNISLSVIYSFLFLKQCARSKQET